MNLAVAFAASARAHAQQPAIYWGEQTVCYQGLYHHACQVAGRLSQHLAVRPGDRVGLWLKNCPEFVSAFLGILQAGGVVVPINNFLKAEEVNYILADAGIEVLITDAALAGQSSALVAARAGLKLELVETSGQIPPSHPGFVEPEYPRRREADLAVLIYTSGTTGRPKGAMLSHGNLLHNVESCRQVFSVIDHDRFVVVLPMFHSFMLTVGVLLPLLVGGSMIVVKSLHPPKSIFEEIIRHRGTILPCIPQFFRTLANAPLPPEIPLRLCISGGAPLPGEILREFNARRPGLPLVEGYGLSEASPVVSVNPLLGPCIAGSIGVPIPGVEMSVQNDAGQFLAPGVTGEICVRGGNVMTGYWGQPAASAQALRHGWLLTGDVGHRDRAGYYYITDRKNDMLLVNGINVYPREIEEVLYRFEGVKEAAVIGVPDSRKGEHPVAFIAAQEGRELDAKAILRFVRSHLADYKVPKEIKFLAALPRNATGKILKTNLRDQSICGSVSAVES